MSDDKTDKKSEQHTRPAAAAGGFRELGDGVFTLRKVTLTPGTPPGDGTYIDGKIIAIVAVETSNWHRGEHWDLVKTAGGPYEMFIPPLALNETATWRFTKVDEWHNDWTGKGPLTGMGQAVPAGVTFTRIQHLGVTHG